MKGGKGEEREEKAGGRGKGGRGNADWQSAQYKESNGGKNATEGNKEDGGAVPDSIGRKRRKGTAKPCPNSIWTQ